MLTHADVCQVQYKAALASAAGTVAANVEIISITEARRRAGSVNVDTKVSREGQSESFLSLFRE
jgi:hypothetical protein